MTRQEELITQEATYDPIYVARQPIFTAERGIWGYELLFRHSAEARFAELPDPDVATAKVIADGFSLAVSGMSRNTRALINFPRNLLLSGAATVLPRENCIVEILETVEPEPAIIEALRALKDKGYTLALDDYIGQPGYEEILELADIVKVELLGMSPPEIIKLTQKLKKTEAALLAEKVEDRQIFELTRKLGYAYFQGYYFSKPEIVEGRKLPAQHLSRIRLMGEVSRSDFDFKRTASIISSDLSLSYRLLKFINSSSFGMSNEVKSIQQALPLLGYQPLKKWLMVVLISESAQQPREMELSYSSVVRGRFLELLAESMPMPPHSIDAMFTLGLFSRLDSLLNQPMEEIVEHLPLQQDIRDALIGHENPIREWLDLTMAIEAAKWDKAERLLSSLGVNPKHSASSFAQASDWAHQLLLRSGTDAVM